MTVSSTQKTGTYHQSLTVVVFSGASGIGATSIGSGATGGPSVSIATTAPGSLVYGVGNDWDHATSRTTGSNQSMVHQWVDTAVGDTFWLQSRTAPVPAAGSTVSINDTAPTADRWNLAAVEIIR